MPPNGSRRSAYGGLVNLKLQDILRSDPWEIVSNCGMFSAQVLCLRNSNGDTWRLPGAIMNFVRKDDDAQAQFGIVAKKRSAQLYFRSKNPEA